MNRRMRINSKILMVAIMLFITATVFQHSAHAANIVQIVVDETGIPFVLDDNGHVWGFKDPRALQNPVRLPNSNILIESKETNHSNLDRDEV